MSPARRAWAARVALAVGALAISLLACEVGLRVGAVTPTRYPRLRSIENAAKTAGVDAYPTNPWGDLDLDLRDPAVRAPLEAAGVPGLARVARRTPFGVGFRYNPEHCRNADVGPRAPGVARVLVVGDSFTEGQGVREPDTFARRLERTLREEGRTVDVINCGRRGRDFPDIATDFAARLAYEPDVVLYAMVLNDPVQSAEFRARQAFLNDWILDRRRMLGERESGGVSFWDSRLRMLVEERLETQRVGRATTRWYLDMYGPPNREGWAATVEHLRNMNAAMAERGGRLVVALLPLLVGLEGRYPFEEPAAEVRRACEANGIAFHDALGAVRGQPTASLWVHPVDMHPNAAAHARFAADLAPVVAAALDARGAR